ncbi:hypothetical protein PR048_005198 [Dryococelus australis]|uniref:Uncharacterized protein n=1 Tax=Dryococelus australis TaxID=614101 RepID=A0ABQ9I7J5_9NEOP|nr:hypothetical protein PR048_005198 [Dryococelus australis]
MENCKPVQTPLELQPNYDVTKECIANAKPYRELVGSLMYACLTTRPDICTAVNFYSQFQTDATERQWVGLKRVLRYLQGTLDLGFRFKGISDVSLLGYADTDFANRPDKKSVTGYLFEMYGDAVCWATKKQQTVALSTTESEFVARPSAIDNQSCICAVGSWKQKRLKYIDIKYKFINDLCQNNVITIRYIPSVEQKADMLTKGLSSDLFVGHRKHLGMIEVPSHTLA